MDKNRGFPLGHDKVCSYCHLMHIHSDCGHWGELCDRCNKPEDYNVVNISKARADREKRDRLIKTNAKEVLIDGLLPDSTAEDKT